MIKFDPSKLVFETQLLKSVTSALGGSIQIVDPESPEGEENYIKKKIPFAVARKFIQSTKITAYLKPVEVAILCYDGHVICLERDALVNMRDAKEGDEKWVSNIEKFVNEWVGKALATADDWYIDGRYVYSFPEGEPDRLVGEVDGQEFLSKNKAFRMGTVNCIDLYEANTPVWPQVGVLIEDRGVIAFVASNGQWTITPPIWKNVDAIGSSATVENDSRTDQDDLSDATTGITVSDERRAELLDRLDQNYSLNLNFTLNSAKLVSNMFGFDAVEPLQLPEIMLSLKTVNIPSLPKSIKSTFSVGLTPSFALAWLMGFLDKSKTLDDYIAIRAAIKYLTSKGMFHQKSTKLESLFVHSDRRIPPLMERTQIIKD